MDEDAISISVSDDERAFIDSQLAAGRYATEEEVFRAGLAALKRESLVSGGFNETDKSASYELEDVEELRGDLARSAASGVSRRQMRDIMEGVKAKLRANGAL